MRGLIKQQGLSSSNLVVVIALFGFFLTLAFKMGPVYLDNMGVRSAMKSLAEGNPDLASMSKGEVRSQLSRYFLINNIRDKNITDIEVVKQKDRLLINDEYEVRVPLFLNVDVVMAFRNQIDTSNIEACCKFLVEHAPTKQEE